jgi:DNA-binding LytR/AlgR family response regulator
MSAIKIGIVEDEGITSEVIKLSLQKLKYNIATPAFTFDQALQMFENENPDLVLIDIKLGEKEDGIELAEILKEKYDTPFIFITANSDTATLERAKKVNPLAFLVKPFSQVDLHASIEIAFNNYKSDKIKNKQKNNVVLIKVGRSFEKINTNEILFLENVNHYFNIHFTKGEDKMVRASAVDMLDMLPKNYFIQISRTYIINSMHIDKIDSTTVYIGKKKLEYKTTLKESILKLMKENI